MLTHAFILYKSILANNIFISSAKRVFQARSKIKEERMRWSLSIILIFRILLHLTIWSSCV